MDPGKMISFDLRNLSILIKRYIEKDKKNEILEHEDKHCLLMHHGVTHMHMAVMDYLYTNKDRDIFQKDFEKAFSIRKSTSTNMLKRIEKQGLIKRIPVPEDARLKKIILTKKALEFAKHLDEKSIMIEKKLTKGLTEDEIETLHILLNKMKNNLENND